MATYRRVYDSACMSLWAWWEVVAAHHWVMTMHADCLESGISSGPLHSTMSMGTMATFYYISVKSGKMLSY